MLTDSGRPQARDLLLQHMDHNDFEELRALTSYSISVNWPHSDYDVVLTSADGKDMVLNPAFVSHIADIKNWSVGPDVASRFSFLQGIPIQGGQRRENVST